VSPGPPPKPTKLKILAGNPGRRPLNEAEPAPPVPSSTPYVPRWLDPEAKREWRRITKVLIELGLYTELDRAALIMYCQAWALYVKAQKELATTDLVLTGTKGGQYQSPWLGISNRAHGQLRAMLAEFGLSPAQRARVVATPAERERSLAEILFEGTG